MFLILQTVLRPQSTKDAQLNFWKNKFARGGTSISHVRSFKKEKFLVFLMPTLYY